MLMSHSLGQFSVCAYLYPKDPVLQRYKGTKCLFINGLPKLFFATHFCLNRTEKGSKKKIPR